MTNSDMERIVLADQEGNLYAFTRDMLDRARLSPEHAAELRAELDKVIGDSDVSGYSHTVTSQALGEEAGSGRPAPDLTTLALGEEGGTHLDPIRLPFDPPWFRNVPY
jgi:hypothetical protein